MSDTQDSPVALVTGGAVRVGRAIVEELARRVAARPDAGELSTEQALRDSEERLRLVRRATGLGMYEIDWVARRRYWSPELRALLRYRLDVSLDAIAPTGGFAIKVKETVAYAARDGLVPELVAAARERTSRSG